MVRRPFTFSSKADSREFPSVDGLFWIWVPESEKKTSEVGCASLPSFCVRNFLSSSRVKAILEKFVLNLIDHHNHLGRGIGGEGWLALSLKGKELLGLLVVQNREVLLVQPGDYLAGLVGHDDIQFDPAICGVVCRWRSVRQRLADGHLLRHGRER